MIISRPVTVDDIYMFDDYISTPGVREGLFERAMAGEPDFITEETDSGPAIYYRAPHGEIIGLGRPPAVEMAEPSLEGLQLAAGPSATRTDAPQGYGSGEKATGVTLPIQQQQRELYATGEATAVDKTNREKLASFLTESMVNLGADRYKTRERVESFIGGTSSRLPLNLGLVDFVPFLGTFLQSEEAAILLGQAKKSAERGNTTTAAIEGVGGVLGLVPGAIGTAKFTKKAVEELGPTAGKMAEDYLTKTGVILNIAPGFPAVQIPSAPKINTLAFKNWFGDSKIVNQGGQPLVMYHGTKHQFDKFDPNVGYQGAMFFSPKRDFAENYMGGTDVSEPIAVYISAKNPFDYENPVHRQKVIDLAIENTAIYKNSPDQKGMRRVLNEALTAENANWTTIEDRGFQDAIKKLGFDSFYVKEGGVKNLAVYNPTQIKSVFNKGTFDPKDPRIMYGGGTAGAATMQDKERK